MPPKTGLIKSNGRFARLEETLYKPKLELPKNIPMKYWSIF